MKSKRVQRVKPTARLISLGFFFVTLFFVLSFPRLAQVSRSNPEPKNTVKPDIEEIKKAVVREDYGKLPLSFIQNEGQVEKKVKFYEKGSNRTTFFTDNGIYLSFTDKQSSSTSDNAQPALIKLTPMGANKHPKIIAEGIQEGKVNYFIGNDPKKWKTKIPTYHAVVYQEIYPGIDLKFYGNNQQMEYDIIVKPGADPAKVKLAYEGIEGLRVTDAGDLEIGLSGGKILQKKPFVYQEIDGKRVDVAGKFKVHPERFAYGFEVASYDKAHPLIVDPALVYSTYLGGGGNDRAYGIAVDASGNAYVAGLAGPNFPGTPLPGQVGTDVFVSKFNPAGSALVYSTYLGGSGGEGEHGGIAVDASGNAYVIGLTQSTNFPTVNAFQGSAPGGGNAFVFKLNASGNALLYSTYLGGSAGDQGNGIAVDSSGNAYVTGATYSINFPTAGPLQATCGACLLGGTNAFVSKINPAGSALVYSTYLGEGGFGITWGYGIAVDNSGNAYVTGLTNGFTNPSFPTVNPLQLAQGGNDAFVSKLNPAGTVLLYSTYLGGNGNDQGNGIAVDALGNAYVTGWTASSNFPTASPIQSRSGGSFDAFVTKFNPSGSALVYSTYLGGSGYEEGDSIAVNISGNAYVTGETLSSNFPTADPVQGSYGGSTDAFVSKLNAAGSSLVYSTYLGGNQGDQGYGIATDASGSAYVTGTTSSSNFPTASPLQPTPAGVFVTKISGPINHPPSAGSVTPMNSMTETGMSQMFTALYSDPDGWPNIAVANLYFSGNGGLHNEWLHYLVAPNLFTMMGSNDSCNPGQPKMLTNGYLTLDCGLSSISGSGNVLTVIFQVTPQMSSSGIMYSMFSAASDQYGAAHAIFAGTWQIP